MGWQFPKLLYTYILMHLFINSNCLMIIKSIVLLRWVSNSMVMNVSKIGFKDVEKRQMKINKIYFVSTGAKLLDVYRIIK